MEIIFWLVAVLGVYCYVGYPLILSGIAQSVSRLPKKGACEPTVSVVLAAWNEEDVIRRKIDNLIALDYPHDKIEFLIASDGSTDRTGVIIRETRDSRIQFIENVQRQGKMMTINALVGRAQNEIVVFTDARQIFEKSAVRVLISNFADPAVGCVSGELIFSKKDGSTARGISAYWDYEKWIRRAESNIHSMLGATGAIYAIRRNLFSPIPAHMVLDDMFVPLEIIRRGYRAVFDPSAKAFDEVADDPREEYRRKARTLFGNYQIFRAFGGMLNPFRSPIALQLFSHKLLRVLMPFFMIAFFLANWALTGPGASPASSKSGYPIPAFYDSVFAAQVIFYVMAVVGALARRQKYGILRAVARICFVPYVFCLLNLSALAGFLRFARSKQDITWEKARDSGKAARLDGP